MLKSEINYVHLNKIELAYGKYNLWKDVANMKISTKILAGFILMAFIGMILGVVGLISTKSLTNLSNDLFVLEQESAGVTSVLNAHFSWRQALVETALTGNEFNGSLDPTTCALGKWSSSDEAKNISDPVINDLLGQIKGPHAFIHDEARSVVDYNNAGEADMVRHEIVDLILPKTQEVIELLSKMEEHYTELTHEKSAEIASAGTRLMLIIVAVMAVALLACAILAFTITGNVIKPLREITSAAEAITVGDLNTHIRYNIDDQIGMLARSFQKLAENTKNQAAIAEALAEGDLTVDIRPRSEKDVMNIALHKMVLSLNDMFQEIQSATAQVASDANQISNGAQVLADGSTEQASTVERVSTAVSRIAKKTQANANLAGRSAAMADEIMSNAEKGSRQMDEMMSAVNEVNQASQAIGKVIKVIDDIAFQTNILALNAAVEAARAGQHGKGFAVVAEEVRNLAAKSAEAAKDTGMLIANSIEKAELGARIAHETAASFVDIVSGINESNKIVREIAESSEDQTTGIGQINESIDKVAQVTQQTSATAEESAAASQELNGQSQILEKLISRFHLQN